MVPGAYHVYISRHQMKSEPQKLQKGTKANMTHAGFWRGSYNDLVRSIRHSQKIWDDPCFLPYVVQKQCDKRIKVGLAH